MLKEFVADSRQRIDAYLSQQPDLGLSRSQIARLIKDEQIKVNQEKTKASYKLKPGDKISITIPPPRKLDVSPEDIPLRVIYEDDDLVVVDKPRGMTVHPGAGRNEGTLVNALLHLCRDLSGIGGVLRPGIVHRLDKDTSGLIVVAKNDFAHQALAKQFKERTVQKKYLALVHGIVKQNQGVIETLIGRHRVKRKKMAVVEEGRGKKAITGFKVVERFKQYALVELELKTGRTHQIRVHMSYLGFPLVGDPLYGKKKEAFKTAGQLLHSAKLGFTHPRTGEYLEFTAPLPEDMEEIIKKLRKK